MLSSVFWPGTGSRPRPRWKQPEDCERWGWKTEPRALERGGAAAAQSQELNTAQLRIAVNCNAHVERKQGPFSGSMVAQLSSAQPSPTLQDTLFQVGCPDLDESEPQAPSLHVPLLAPLPADCQARLGETLKALGAFLMPEMDQLPEFEAHPSLEARREVPPVTGRSAAAGFHIPAAPEKLRICTDFFFEPESPPSLNTSRVRGRGWGASLGSAGGGRGGRPPGKAKVIPGGQGPPLGTLPAQATAQAS
ncbi:hypothetical protein R6Z07M_007876 [Ovis aries]